MRTLFRNLPIGRRLALAFGLLSVLLAVVAGSGVYAVHDQVTVRADQERLATARDEVQELRYLANDAISWEAFIYAEASATSPEAALVADNAAGLVETREAATALLDAFHAGALVDSERTILDRIRTDWSSFFDATDVWTADLARATSPEDMHDAFLVLNEGKIGQLWETLLDDTATLAASIEVRTLALAAEADSRAVMARRMIVALACVVVGLSVALGVAAARSIVRPVGRVVDALDRLAEGDLTASPDVHQRDEIGHLATSFDTTTASLRRIVATMATSADTVAANAAHISATTANVAASASGTADDATGASTAAVAVSRNVATLAAGSEQMGASIQEIARSAQDAADVAAEAVRGAEATAVSVDRLGVSSQEIGEVVAVISSIAAQTNLLALNATIEAARAGEAGKGFAVVASEVKELAQETARATEEITRRVTAIQTDATGAATAIEQIGVVIARISDSQIAIAAAVEEQTLTTREMTRNVTDAASGAEEIASLVDKVAGDASGAAEHLRGNHTAVAELTEMSAQLQELVATFRHE
ncbi:methyl-accepting chemotaxis protein [Nocardioides yefusunii]|uniref:Methyl-accepting chemotaxis protein n=1 Tax=Nocardioides yefusunii TaxID=2500546 RepID=A0ABW1QVX0_9ACTN|nr:methyl-accepting chemotaxis protein [Nocardioides yefusunii]